MTPERIAELRALAEAATPGTWWNESGVVHASYPNATDVVHPASCTHEPDAAFIAAARTALPDALDEIDRLNKVLDEQHGEMRAQQEMRER